MSTLWNSVNGVIALVHAFDYIEDLPNFDAPNGNPFYNSGTQQDARDLIQDLLRTFFTPQNGGWR